MQCLKYAKDHVSGYKIHKEFLSYQTGTKNKLNIEYSKIRNCQGYYAPWIFNAVSETIRTNLSIGNK